MNIVFININFNIKMLLIKLPIVIACVGGGYAFVVIQSLSCVQLFVTPWVAACQAPLSFTVSWSLLMFMSIELVMLSNHLIICHPLLLLSIFPSIRVFSSELAICIR